MSNAVAFVRWEKETPILARLMNGGAKVEFKQGTIKEMDASLAEKFCKRIKGFVIVSPYDLTPKELEVLKAERNGGASVEEEKKPAKAAPKKPAKAAKAADAQE